MKCDGARGGAAPAALLCKPARLGLAVGCRPLVAKCKSAGGWGKDQAAVKGSLAARRVLGAEVSLAILACWESVLLGAEASFF